MFSDKDAYFAGVTEAKTLQTRWEEEANIDIMKRVADALCQATGMTVRLAKEGDREYFAGVVRAIDSGIQIHADHAPYVWYSIIELRVVELFQLTCGPGSHRKGPTGKSDVSLLKCPGTSC